MAINNNFYATINELVHDFTTNDIVASVVDYKTFVDAGRTLQQLSGTDLANGFLTPLMNKVQLTIDTFRAYQSDLAEMYKGTTRGGVIEMITHLFYSARQAPFINLQNTNDDSMIDFVKPEIRAKYYTDENAYQFVISRTDTELRAAWDSPEAMDAFLQTIIGDIANSNELGKEVSRLGLLGGAISEVLNNANINSTTPKPTSQWVDLLGIYNTITGQTPALTKQNALMDKDFVRWSVSFINEFKQWMRKPSSSLNLGGVVTFTPLEAQRTKISADFDAAIRRSLWQLYNRDGAMLSDYEVLPYWGYQSEPGNVGVYVDGQGSDLTGTVLACVYDDYALGEYVNLESVTSERNNKKLYTTYYWNGIRRYIRNDNANFVVFTLGNITGM